MCCGSAVYCNPSSEIGEMGLAGCYRNRLAGRESGRIDASVLAIANR